PAALAVARPGPDLARAVLRCRDAVGPRGLPRLRGVPAPRRCAARVRGDQDRQLRPAVAGVLHRRAQDVPVLRGERRPRVPPVARDVGAGRILAAGTGPPGAGAGPCLRVAVAAGRPAARPVWHLAVPQLAARGWAAAGAGAVLG